MKVERHSLFLAFPVLSDVGHCRRKCNNINIHSMPFYYIVASLFSEVESLIQHFLAMLRWGMCLVIFDGVLVLTMFAFIVFMIPHHVGAVQTGMPQSLKWVHHCNWLRVFFSPVARQYSTIRSMSRSSWF